MKTAQLNIRLDPDLVAALERVAREESLDRATALRRLLETSIQRWQVERALRDYQRGDLSLGRAAEEAGISQWELIERARNAGIAYPLTGEEARARLGEPDRVADSEDATLPDLPPRPGGVLLVGVNPAPASVAAGHYYQGRLGRRLWQRLERLGLLHEPLPGAEDEAFTRAGNGLTDVVKRATESAAELSRDELQAGASALGAKVDRWEPGLLLFAFKQAARAVLGVAAAAGPAPDFRGVPTFLLSGPYAPRAEAERIDALLRRVLAAMQAQPAGGTARTQRSSPRDLASGQIRIPRDAKRFLPPVAGELEIVLRGRRLRGRYDPRTGPDRERSGVIRFGRGALAGLVHAGETLRVAMGVGGVVRMD